MPPESRGWATKRGIRPLDQGKGKRKPSTASGAPLSATLQSSSWSIRNETNKFSVGTIVEGDRESASSPSSAGEETPLMTVPSSRRDQQHAGRRSVNSAFARVVGRDFGRKVPIIIKQTQGDDDSSKDSEGSSSRQSTVAASVTYSKAVGFLLGFSNLVIEVLFTASLMTFAATTFGLGHSAEFKRENPDTFSDLMFPFVFSLIRTAKFVQEFFSATVVMEFGKQEPSMSWPRRTFEKFAIVRYSSVVLGNFAFAEVISPGAIAYFAIIIVARSKIESRSDTEIRWLMGTYFVTLVAQIIWRTSLYCWVYVRPKDTVAELVDIESDSNLVVSSSSSLVGKVCCMGSLPNQTEVRVTRGVDVKGNSSGNAGERRGVNSGGRKMMMVAISR